jgi:hypothetical protein
MSKPNLVAITTLSRVRAVLLGHLRDFPNLKIAVKDEAALLFIELLLMASAVEGRKYALPPKQASRRNAVLLAFCRDSKELNCLP